jgi:hypothetical protein
MFTNIYFHPKNKMDITTLKRDMSLPELLDYQEALDVAQLLEEAAHKDSEQANKQPSR